MAMDKNVCFRVFVMKPTENVARQTTKNPCSSKKGRQLPHIKDYYLLVDPKGYWFSTSLSILAGAKLYEQDADIRATPILADRKI